MEMNKTLNRSAFPEIYREYKNVIQAYITYRIKRRYEAEDLTQDVFVRLLSCGQTINMETADSFLFTIARNIVTDRIRREYKRQEVMDCMEHSAAVSKDVVEQNMGYKELTSIYECQINVLPKQRQCAYKLVDCEDYSINEAAQIMGISNRTVEAHLYIARKEIRTRLKGMLMAAV